jgi:hypothetical protein
MARLVLTGRRLAAPVSEPGFLLRAPRVDYQPFREGRPTTDPCADPGFSRPGTGLGGRDRPGLARAGNPGPIPARVSGPEGAIFEQFS